MHNEKKRPLGRGLSSLFRHQEEDPITESVDISSGEPDILQLKNGISEKGLDIPQNEPDIYLNESDISQQESDIYLNESHMPSSQSSISPEEKKNIKVTPSLNVQQVLQNREKQREMYKKMRSKALPIAEDYKERNLAQEGAFQHLPIHSLKPGPFQPRVHFKEEELKELADSIKENGILQPLLVRHMGNAIYEIIAGERRWRAAKLAGLKQVPVVIKVLTNEEAHAAAIVENIQREDLTPLEEAKAYENLISNLNYTQQDISTLVGKSRSYISNVTRLLSLPERVLNYIQTGDLTPGHARLLINLPEEEALKFAERMVKNKLNVRNAERLLKRSRIPEEAEKATPASIEAVYQDPEIQVIENQLREALGVEVTLKNQGNQGFLILKFMNLNQLDDIIEKLTYKASS